MYASIEDKHWCNTKNLETVQGAGIHEMVVRRRLHIHAQPLQLNQINASKNKHSNMETLKKKKYNTNRYVRHSTSHIPSSDRWILGILFDIFILILTPRFIRIAKRMKDPRTGLPALHRHSWQIPSLIARFVNPCGMLKKNRPERWSRRQYRVSRTRLTSS